MPRRASPAFPLSQTDHAKGATGKSILNDVNDAQTAWARLKTLIPSMITRLHKYLTAASNLHKSRIPFARRCLL